MQTLHFACGTFRALRAISLRHSPSRWQTRSMRAASKWETASPLPNPLRPTCAVGSRPASQHPDRIRCPGARAGAGAGLPGVSRLRAARIVGPHGADPCRVCPGQTASDPSSYPAPYAGVPVGMAGDLEADHWQAHASEVARSRARPSPGRSPRRALPPSAGLSDPLRPQRCQRAPRSRAGAPPVRQRNAPHSSGNRFTGPFSYPPRRFRKAASPIGEQTADPVAHVGSWSGVSSGARWRRSHCEAG